MNQVQLIPSIDYKKASFFISASTVAQCPQEDCREIAFIGRSNAGKSSAINTLTEQRKLARTSKTPGRTQLLNFFELSANTYLVDLPGFGYAKVSPAIKHKWQKQLELYLQERKSLRGLVLLMDIRHPFKEFDLMMIKWAEKSNMPLHILLTKSDKLKNGAARSCLLSAQKQLNNHSIPISIQLFSSLKNDGIKILRKQLDKWLFKGDS